MMIRENTKYLRRAFPLVSGKPQRQNEHPVMKPLDEESLEKKLPEDEERERHLDDARDIVASASYEH